MRAYATWQLDCTFLPYIQSATSYAVPGSGISSGLSSDSNTDRLEPSRFWNGRELYSSSHPRTAPRSSSSDANARSRIAPASAMVACHTVFSADGLSFGLRTRPGITAAE